MIYHSGNLAYLINDDGSVWTYVPPGGSVSNSQCTINGTSGSDSGNNWTFNVSVTFQPGYVGAAKPISLYVIDHAGQSYGWQQVGTYTVSGPPAGAHRTGVKSTGSYWGAAGEQIDLLSGNLNYSIPLIQARGRGGPGMNFALSYNSQIWQQSGGTTSLLDGIWASVWAGRYKRGRCCRSSIVTTFSRIRPARNTSWTKTATVSGPLGTACTLLTIPPNTGCSFRMELSG